MEPLAKKHCLPCEGKIKPLTNEEITQHLSLFANWQFDSEKQAIWRGIDFKSYKETILFVNAVAWMAEQEQHHPDLHVSYKHCIVYYTTHALKGLSENDFICAAKVDHLLQIDKVNNLCQV